MAGENQRTERDILEAIEETVNEFEHTVGPAVESQIEDRLKAIESLLERVARKLGA